MNIITKSDYLRYLQCGKYLWLYKHRKDLMAENTPERERIFEQGYEVENLARGLFKKGIEAGGEFNELAAKTRQLIKEGHKIIYQAAAMPKGLMAKADILVFNNKTKKWDIYEVKSSTEIRDEHYPDMAFQKIAFARDGYDIGKTYIVIINKEFVKNGEIDPHEFFIIRDISDEVNNILSTVEADIPKALATLEEKAMPEVRILKQCNNPHDCPFIGYCRRDIPSPSIYDLSLSEKKLNTLLDQGIIGIGDVPENMVTASKQKFYRAVKTGKPQIDRKAIAGWIKKLVYPLHFLDFETYNPAIPIFNGYRPYQQIPFQYSLYVIEKPGAKPVHYEHLRTRPADPVPALGKTLAKQIGRKGSVIAWNMGFEKSRNAEMAERIPEYAKFFKSVNQRMADLMAPVRSGAYVHPDFLGSASIKNVLPVMAPELSYKNLEIRDGGMAALAWRETVFGNEDDEEKAITFNNLLKYCEMDTWAMVRILEVMKKTADG